MILLNRNLLKITNACVNFSGRKVLDSVSLSIQENEIITIIGPNGAGKTTLVKIILGLQSPNSGILTRKSGISIGYMPQKLHIESSMPLSVYRFLSLSGAKISEIDNSLRKTGVFSAKHSPLKSVSGGEMQRILLARALLCCPDLLVLDEPVQGVDINGQSELYHLISEIKCELNCSVLMVSHDLHLVMAATDKVICLNGHICCSGHPHQVTKHPAYLKLFGQKFEELAIYKHQHDALNFKNSNVISHKKTKLKDSKHLHA